LTDTIEVVVRLTISEEDCDVNRLEKRVRAARDEAGRQLFVRALARLEEEALAAHPKATRQRRVERHLDTTLGHVGFERWRGKGADSTTCLLDRLLGLPRNSRASPAVKRRAAELASRMTYREASTVLSEELGTPVSAQSVHAWVQPLGEAVMERELAPTSALPPTPARDVVVAEWDDTMLRSQQAGERQFAMKLGIGYSQKERQGPKRWKLADKAVYGGVEEPENFAERFYARMESCFQVEQAQPVVVKGDGAEWICQGAAQVFPQHVFQLDRWHLLDRSAQFASQQPRLWKRLRRWVFQGRVESLRRSLPGGRRRTQRTSAARVAGLCHPTRRSEHRRGPAPPPPLARRSPFADPRNRSDGKEHRDGHWPEVQTLGHALDTTRRSPPPQAPPLDRSLRNKLVRSLVFSRSSTDKCLTQPTTDFCFHYSAQV